MSDPLLEGPCIEDEDEDEKTIVRPLAPMRPDLWVAEIWDLHDLGNAARLGTYEAAQKLGRMISRDCPEARLGKLGRLVRFKSEAVKSYLGLDSK